MPALYFNNLGCIHHSLRKHSAAAFYFQKALGENSKLVGVVEPGGVPLPGADLAASAFGSLGAMA